MIEVKINIENDKASFELETICKMEDETMEDFIERIKQELEKELLR